MHLMYVDESGDTGFPKPGALFPDTGGPTRQFVRSGVIVHSWKWQQVDHAVSQFKRARNMAWDAEIKANDLRSGHGAFKHWPEQDRRVFLLDLLETIGRELDLSIIGVRIDKTRIDINQRERFSNPSVRSLELLLERYNEFLALQKDRTGIVILDSVEATQDQNLRYFQNYLRNFSDHLDARRIVEGTLFLPSHTCNLLQVADVCANVLYREISHEMQRINKRMVAQKTWP